MDIHQFQNGRSIADTRQYVNDDKSDDSNKVVSCSFY